MSEQIVTQSDLNLLQESVVKESEIDSLGHMNVRFYVSRAAHAHFKLLADLGVVAGEGEALRRTDTYNRFHKEQFAGARLGVYGGLISIEGNDGMSGYYEIRNLETNDIAATFVITSNLVNVETDQFLHTEDMNQAKADAFHVEVPDYGQPRTLNLLPPKQVAFAELAALMPEESSPHTLNGRREGLVLEEDCDSEGRLKEEVDPMFVMFRPQPGEDLKKMGPPVQRDEHGRRYSFAMMEIRSVNWRRPRLGNTIVSLSADVAYGEKWRHTRRWIFAKESGELLGISDHAGLCMDLDARRAIPIPAVVREEMERTCLPQYA
jgi:acyl-CoA thioester hydrolase